MNIVFHDTAEPYEREYQRARAAFIAVGSTLNSFLQQEGIDRQLAYRALKGQSFGKKAIAVRAKVLRHADKLSQCVQDA